MKYYAVAKGITPGIYTTWPEAQKQILKFSGAVYKSFTTLDQAKEYMRNYHLDPNGQPLNNPLQSTLINSSVEQIKPVDYAIYVDGSADNLNKTPRGGAGIVIVNAAGQCIAEHIVPILHHPFCTNNLAELIGVEQALVLIKNLPIKSSIKIFLDSTYVLNHLIGRQIKFGQPNYQKVVQICQIHDQIVNLGYQITLHHIEAHKGHQWNELADRLANEGRTMPIKEYPNN